MTKKFNNRKNKCYELRVPRYALKIRLLGPPRKRDHVANIPHAVKIQYGALEAQAETGVLDPAVFPEIEIPPIILFFKAAFRHPRFQDIDPFFPLAPPDHLSYPGNQEIHGGDGFSVIVQTHVESLDLFRVVGHEDRLFKNLVREIAFVLGLQIDPPFYRIIEFFWSREEDIDRFRIRHPFEIGI